MKGCCCESNSKFFLLFGVVSNLQATCPNPAPAGATNQRHLREFSTVASVLKYLTWTQFVLNSKPSFLKGIVMKRVLAALLVMVSAVAFAQTAPVGATAATAGGVGAVSTATVFVVAGVAAVGIAVSGGGSSSGTTGTTN